MDNLTALYGFMLGIAFITVGGGYVIYRWQLFRWLRSLRWAVMIAMFLTVGLVFLTVLVTAQLMFISDYDLRITAGLLLFAGLIALVFGFLVTSALTDYIRKMGKAAEALANGGLDTRLEPVGNDELARFAHQFNHMVSSLQAMDEERRALEQSRRNLIAWASHDLRTPLTAIRVMTEAISDGVVDDRETMQRYLTNTNVELHYLSRLIDNLFELAQLDAGHAPLQTERASLSDLISDTLGSMNVRAQTSGITLRGTVDATIDPVDMAVDKIQRVLNNLLDNALRYTPSGGHVMIKAMCDDDNRDTVRVTVQNYAPNMVLPDAEQIFTRFYRQEVSRAQSKDGYRGAGLGLAIARGFIEMHGGKIWVTSTPAEGVTFTFTLPRVQHAVW